MTRCSGPVLLTFESGDKLFQVDFIFDVGKIVR